MRIGSIRLSWFRGAGREALLPANGASVFVYGANGSGKSSFVDGVEVCVNGGKVAHLAHEYSGRHQEKGLINTHRAKGATATVTVSIADSADGVTCEWSGIGAPKVVGLDKVPLDTWDYRRTALRQEEVAEFIRSTKAEKYSALLPLLGLQPLETAAENLRRIGREMVVLSKLDELRRSVGAVHARRKAAFGEADFPAMLATLRLLRDRYLAKPDSEQPALGATSTITAVIAAIETRLNSLDAQSREAAALQDIVTNRLAELVQVARAVVAEIALVAEPLVKERLDILNAAAAYRAGLMTEGDLMECPACGTSVRRDEFRDHVAAERDRLQHIDTLFGRHAEAVAAVCEEAARLRIAVTGAALASWRSAQVGPLATCFDYLNGLNFSTLRAGCRESDLVEIEGKLGRVVAAATTSAGVASPDVQGLIKDKELAETIRAVIQAQAAEQQISRIEALLAFTAKLEELVRDEIRQQAQRVFGSISADIQRLWDVLHPGQQISDVRLHVPGDADKAIDVALKFYGVEQESPRLTLSEGQRNALGLCIFLAMAKQGGGDRPIILDDVVVSMDRDHRSQVAVLLEKEFADRQILLLTHDREWFFELSRFLKKPRWSSLRLMPWAGPEIGIRLADQAGDFAKARANILSDPEDAESNVRRIMDQGLAEIAERLEVPMPFLRGDENDHRTGGQFIGRIAGRAKSAFRVKSGIDPQTGAPTYDKNTAAVVALETVAPQLAAWANRATHTFSASSSEAQIIIDNCEVALEGFDCDECDTPVWHCAVGDAGHLECRCGKLQWRS